MLESAFKPPRISVVIPTYNRGVILADTILMALVQDYPEFEVIVVDQSMELPDAVREAIDSSSEKLNYLRLTTPNLPGARNAGVRAASGEIISFIDDDVVIGPEYLAGIAEHFRNPSVGAVMGMTLSPDGGEPDPESVLKQYYASQVFSDGTAEVGWVVGCNSSYRKRLIIEAGMSDEKFTGSAWSEDVDLSVRVRHLGYKLIYDPRVRLTHLQLASGGCANRSAADLENRNEQRFRMLVYFSFKNRRILGFREVSHNVCRAYRQYALCRPLFRAWHRLLFRQFRFARILYNAASMCGTSGTLPEELRMGR